MNEHDLIDAALINQIALRRYLARETREMLKLFEQYDKLTAQLLRRRYNESMLVGSPELKKLYAEVADLRTELMGKANRRARNMSKELAGVEANKEWSSLLLLLLGGAAGARKAPKTPTLSDILNTPFASGVTTAATFKQWLQRLRSVDMFGLRDTLARSVTESAPTSMLVERVIGSKEQNFSNGVLSRTRNNIRALLDTLVTHVSNFVRMHIWLRTPEVPGVVWVSVLDKQTTAICRSRDNKVAMFGSNMAPKGARLLKPKNARPPAHVRCRSTMAPLRAGAVMPKRRTYADWLKGQSAYVQEDILGKAKAEMFQSGKLSLDQFVDSSGKEFTAKQLLSAA